MSLNLYDALRHEVGRSCYVIVHDVECSRSSSTSEGKLYRSCRVGHLQSDIHSWMISDFFPVWIASECQEVGPLHLRRPWEQCW